MSNVETSVTGVYQIRNMVNGKLYIGSALDIARRWRDHRAGLRHGRNALPKLQRAWDMYGESAFTFEVIVRCTPQILRKLEEALIRHYHTVEDGYNCLAHTKEFTPERIARAAASNRGRIVTEETRKRLSQSLKGRVYSSETITKLAQSKLGVKKSPETIAKMRKPKSEAARRAMSEAARRRVATPEGRVALLARGLKAASQHVGKSHSRETIEKLRKPKSEAARKAMSVAARRRYMTAKVTTSTLEVLS